ncbi:AraC family transcriptional regulator [Sulfitobacter sp.]|nr:AraC family transcriptional regulator [Sulfitobacter sp.]
MGYRPDHDYFAHYPVLRTSDLDEARHRVAEKFCDHKLDMATRDGKLRVSHNAVRGRNLSVNYLSYGADVKVDPGYLDAFYMFQIPLAGCARIRHRDQEVVADVHTGAVLNPDRSALLQWDAASRQIIFQIDATHLETVATQLCGAPLPGPVRFDMAVDFTNTGGQRLYQSFMACAHAIERSTLFGGALSSAEIQAEQTLVEMLLTHQHSNISHILARVGDTVRPHAIRCALDFMHANLAEPLRIDDISQACGINVRTLQKGFRQALGQTPMQVLRDARLDTAYYLLNARADTNTVSDAAYSAGFSHLGRFALQYRARFGHSPSRRR